MLKVVFLVALMAPFVATARSMPALPIQVAKVTEIVDGLIVEINSNGTVSVEDKSRDRMSVVMLIDQTTVAQLIAEFNSLPPERPLPPGTPICTAAPLMFFEAMGRSLPSSICPHVSNSADYEPARVRLADIYRQARQHYLRMKSR